MMEFQTREKFDYAFHYYYFTDPGTNFTMFTTIKGCIFISNTKLGVKLRCLYINLNSSITFNYQKLFVSKFTCKQDFDIQQSNIVSYFRF